MCDRLRRGSLADILLENTVDMNFHMKLQCALDAANGMLYLHNSNPVILHRDLKSDNLLVTNDWTVKVSARSTLTPSMHTLLCCCCCCCCCC